MGSSRNADLTRETQRRSRIWRSLDRRGASSDSRKLREKSEGGNSWVSRSDLVLLVWGWGISDGRSGRSLALPRRDGRRGDARLLFPNDQPTTICIVATPLRPTPEGAGWHSRGLFELYGHLRSVRDASLRIRTTWGIRRCWWNPRILTNTRRSTLPLQQAVRRSSAFYPSGQTRLRASAIGRLVNEPTMRSTRRRTILQHNVHQIAHATPAIRTGVGVMLGEEGSVVLKATSRMGAGRCAGWQMSRRAV